MNHNSPSSPFEPSRDSYRIFIFNPETDYALAAGKTLYNVPEKIRQLRKKMAFCQAPFASQGDAFLMLDSREETDRIKIKGIDTVGLEEINKYIRMRKRAGENPILLPWGWNHTLRHILLKAGVDSQFLKSEEAVDAVRDLSHRRTAILFNRQLKKLSPSLTAEEAKEFFNVDEALDFCRINKDVFLKAPWSSSGRGVLRTSDLDLQRIEKWISGCIRRQGSVMGEIAHSKTGDFATEWWVSGGTAHFLGLSMFNATTDGKYLANHEINSGDIEKEISNLTPFWSNDVVEAQKSAIQHIIAGKYSGPLGIDMLTTTKGSLVGCVEINLRFTMGMVSLFKTFKYV